MKKILFSSLALAAATALTPAQAADGLVDEARFAIYSAQPTFLESNHAESDQVGIGASVIFAPVNIDLFGLGEGSDSGFVQAIFNPRPHFGGMANLDEDGTSYVFGDLNWQFNLTERLFLEGGFGMAYTNGSKQPTKKRAGLGAHWQFHETVSLGYRFTPNMNVLVSFEHLSHRRLFSDNNRGLSNLSVKLGYAF